MLRDCALDDGGAELLASTIYLGTLTGNSCLALQIIDLNCNSISTRGVVSLAQAAILLPSLEHLNLDDQRRRTLQEWTKVTQGKEK